LDAGLQTIAKELGIESDIEKVNVNNKGGNISPREEIGFDDLYEFLVKSNKMDSEVYEWSKSIAYVKCDEL
jgi:hypothetical protein